MIYQEKIPGLLLYGINDLLKRYILHFQRNACPVLGMGRKCSASQQDDRQKQSEE